MVAKPTWDRYNEECVIPKKPASLEECETLFIMLYAQVGRNVNPYALDYPVCTEDSMVSSITLPASCHRCWKTIVDRHWMTCFVSMFLID